MLCQVFWTLIVDFLPPSWNTFAAKRFARTQCTPGRKKLELSLLRISAQQGAAVGAAKASNGDVVMGFLTRSCPTNVFVGGYGG